MARFFSCCMGPQAFLRRVTSSNGKFLLNVEIVVASDKFDTGVKALSDSAVRPSQAGDGYEICGVPYIVSGKVASGLAEVRARRHIPE